MTTWKKKAFLSSIKCLSVIYYKNLWNHKEGGACITPWANVAQEQSLSCNNSCWKEACLQSVLQFAFHVPKWTVKSIPLFFQGGRININWNANHYTFMKKAADMICCFQHLPWKCVSHCLRMCLRMQILHLPNWQYKVQELFCEKTRCHGALRTISN